MRPENWNVMIHWLLSNIKSVKDIIHNVVWIIQEKAAAVIFALRMFSYYNV